MLSGMAVLRRIGIAVAVAVFLQSQSSAQSTHPLAGTWQLNLAKSTYDPPNLAPKSGMTVYVVTGDTMKGVTDGVDAQGRATHSEYMVKFDGKDYPWTGTINGQPNTSQDTVSFRRIDDRTFDILNKLKGKVVITQRTVVATDGKTRTTTTVGTNAQGQKISNVMVYDKTHSGAVRQAVANTLRVNANFSGHAGADRVGRDRARQGGHP